MKCPRCRQPVADGEAVCAACGLNRNQLDGHCGVVPMLLGKASSPSGDLTLNELKSLDREIERFESRFPQAKMAVIALRIPGAIDPAVYAFWLINRLNIGPAASPSRAYIVLFILDLSRRCAALTVGYGLETLVHEDELQGILEKGLEDLRDGRPNRAIASSIRTLSDLLQTRLGVQ